MHDVLGIQGKDRNLFYQPSKNLLVRVLFHNSAVGIVFEQIFEIIWNVQAAAIAPTFAQFAVLIYPNRIVVSQMDETARTTRQRVKPAKHPSTKSALGVDPNIRVHPYHFGSHEVLEILDGRQGQRFRTRK